MNGAEVEKKGSGGQLEVTWQEHRVLERVFPSGNDTASWGTHMHPGVHRVVGKFIYAGWSVRDWHKFFSRYNTSQWAQHHEENGGMGSWWTAAEWEKYFEDKKYYYYDAKAVWTLLYLGLTPNVAWRPYASQAKWKEDTEDHDGGGPSSGGSSSFSSASKM